MKFGLDFGLGNQRRLFGGGGGAPPAVWSIAPSDGGATVISSPAFTGAWSITPTDGGATINTFPEVA